MRAKIAVPGEFELKKIEDFLALIFDDDSGKAYVERRIGIAKTLLERLRAKKETYTEDWLEVILEYLGDEELLNHYHELLNEFDEGNISKTKINKIMEKKITEKLRADGEGYTASTLRHDFFVVKKALIDLKIITRTSNRLNLAREYTFSDGLTELIKFYSKWRAGEL